MVKIEQKKTRRKGEGEGQTGVQGGTCSCFHENMILNGNIPSVLGQFSSSEINAVVTLFPKGDPSSRELCLKTSGLQSWAVTL